MELVEELKNAKTVIGVLAGDGPTEFRMLRVISKKYDGSSKVLYFPKLPVYHLGGGLSVLKVIKIYVDKYNIKNFLCIIDREHLKTNAPTEKVIKEKLGEFGVGASSVQKLSADCEEALHIEGKVGAHDFVLWVAITGKEKCIEEDFAKLLETKFKEKVEPTKNDVKSVLKKHKINMEQLLRNTSISRIKQSFPALALALSSLESNETNKSGVS